MATMLYHGPTAREAALRSAESEGRLLAPPFGDDRLKVDTSREIVEMLSSAPVGDQIGTIVVGPFDDATPEASDGLLKLLEDFDGRYVLPVLWAKDVGDVAPTIRSRCLEQWCPAPAGHSPEEPHLVAARQLCEAALRRRTAAVVEHLGENKGLETEIVRAACEVLATEEGWRLEARMKLWERIREVLADSRGNLSQTAMLAAFLV